MNPSTAFARVLVDELLRGGVTDAVVAPGSRSAPVALALADAEAAGRLRLHVRIDERTAAFLALGLAKAAGRPVPVLTTSGTATAHLHAAVLEADASGVPLLALTADRPPELRGTGANQTIDQPGLYGRAVRWAADVGTPEAGREAAQNRYWRSLVARALLVARGELSGDPGPVHLNLALREPLMPDDGAGRAPAVRGTVRRPAGRRAVDQRPARGGLRRAPCAASTRGGRDRTLLVAGDAPSAVGRAAGVSPTSAAGRCWPSRAAARWGPAGAVRGRGAAARLRGLAGGAPARPGGRRRSADAVPAGRGAAGRPGGDGRDLRPDAALGRPRARQHRRSAARTSTRGWRCARAARAGTRTGGGVDRGRRPGWPGGGRRARRRPGRGLTAARLARDVVATLPAGALLVLGSSTPVRDVDRLAVPRPGLTVLANRGVAGHRRHDLHRGRRRAGAPGRRRRAGVRADGRPDVPARPHRPAHRRGRDGARPDRRRPGQRRRRDLRPARAGAAAVRRAATAGSSAPRTGVTWWRWPGRWAGRRPRSATPGSSSTRSVPAARGWSSSAPMPPPRPRSPSGCAAVAAAALAQA